MMHRLRLVFDPDAEPFAGPVEVDETYFGGKRKNMSHARRKEFKDTGQSTAGKTAVVGAKDRKTKRVAARVVQFTDKATLQSFVEARTKPSAQVYTDEAEPT